MVHTDYNGAIRRAMLAALGADANQTARVTRSEAAGAFEARAPDAALGEIDGYRYRQRPSGLGEALGMPGTLTDAGSEWFMDLTRGFPVAVQRGDRLEFANGDARRVALVCGSGSFAGFDIYRLYRLEEA